MSNPLGAGRPLVTPTLPKGEVIATYETYEAAMNAVDALAHADFPVQSTSIVGNDLKSVERVTGRLSWGRAAGAGAVSGLWLGLFLGLVFSIFNAKATTPGFLFGAVLIGAAFGMLFGVASYAVTRRRRDFSSVMQVVASTYSLVVETEVANRAKNVLGLGGLSAAAGAAAVDPEAPLA